ncbi:MAG: polysaccharide deacetylase family protein [Sulfuritalea sp.]|nr:polysaccharide deacetylase family protein [Sulfuritalea sp.]
MIEKLPFLAWPRRQTLTTLIFHRVLPAVDPLRPGEPDPARFERLMSFLAENFAVLPLPEAVERLARGALPRRACCITFDDGYADNLTVALPILEKYRLPATVFVATGYLDGGRMFNDAVIDAIARTRGNALDLRELDLGVHPLGTVEAKLAAISALLDRIKFSPPALRDEQVSAIVAATACGPLAADIMLTTAQLKELAGRGVEIGGHTVSHAILTALDDGEAFAEITQGKRRLEAIIGRPVSSFAYPNGKPGRDYAPRHVPMAQAAGFARAVSTAHGVGTAGCDIFQLPRFTPWGRAPLAWATRLQRNARGG